MNKKQLFLLVTVPFCLLLLFLILPVVRADQLIFDDFVFSGQSVVKNNIVFVFYVGDADRQITFSYDGKYANIVKKECLNINFTKVCYNESTFDPSRNALAARINIYTVSPKVSIIRKVGKSLLFIDEENEVNATISNTGDSTAYNLVYEEEISDVNFTLVENVQIENQRIVWKGDLNKNTNITFRYRYKPLKIFDKSVAARINYSDGIKRQSVTSAPIAIKTVHFIDVKAVFNETDVELGREIIFTFFLTNNKKEDVRIKNLKLRTAEGLLITVPSYEFQKIDNSTYLLPNFLMLGNWTSKPYTKNFTFIVKPVRPSNTELFIDFDFELRTGRTFSMEQIRKGVNTAIKKPKIIMQVDDTIEAYQEKKAVIYIQNPSSFKLFNVSVNFSTNLTIINDVFLTELGRSSTKFLYDGYITGIETGTKKDYPLNVELNYKTEFGDEFTDEFRKTVSVIPAEPIEVDYEVSKDKLESGELADIKVSLKNKRKIDIKNVNVSDAVPEELRPIGIRSNFVSINSGAKIDVYAYSIKAPRVGKETKFSINTTAVYFDGKKFESNEGRQITVIPKKLKLKIERKPDAKQIFRGQIVPIDYVIKNEDNEKIQNIAIVFPVHQNLDLVDNRTYFIEKINPEETITLKGIENIRPKISGGQRLDAASVIAMDEEGYSYNSSTQPLGIAVQESYAPGPEIYATKTADKEISTGNFTVIINIRNIGESTPNMIYVEDDGKKWEISGLEKGSEINLTYPASTNTTGPYKLNRTFVSYSYIDKNYFTASNEKYVQIAKTSAVSEKILPKPTPAVPVEKKEEKPKGFFAGIIDAIKRILYFKKTE